MRHLVSYSLNNMVHYYMSAYLEFIVTISSSTVILFSQKWLRWHCTGVFCNLFEFFFVACSCPSYSFLRFLSSCIIPQLFSLLRFWILYLLLCLPKHTKHINFILLNSNTLNNLLTCAFSRSLGATERPWKTLHNNRLHTTRAKKSNILKDLLLCTVNYY